MVCSIFDLRVYTLLARGKGNQERSSLGEDKIGGYQGVATLVSKSPKQSPGGEAHIP